MAINEEQFNKGLKALKEVRLTDDAKNVIKTRIFSHMATYVPPTKSPYFSHIHFSYKVFATAFVLLFSISVGTTYASFKSLPGDILYPLKTNFAEPAIKLTKFSKTAKEDFDLSLADTRIQEVETLIKEKRINENELEKNFILFEKHLDEKKKDRENNTPKTKDLENTNNISEINALNFKVSQEVEIEDEESNSRVDRYRELIKSEPKLNNFYETNAKIKLDRRRKIDKIENKKEEKEKNSLLEIDHEDNLTDKNTDDSESSTIQDPEDDSEDDEVEINNNVTPSALPIKPTLSPLGL
ncbi:MAG: hypothetical protein AAB438_00315 [Patescibacteria group bacterium]